MFGGLLIYFIPMTGRPLNREEELEWGSKCTAERGNSFITVHNVNRTTGFETDLNTTTAQETNSTLFSTLLNRVNNSTFIGTEHNEFKNPTLDLTS